MKKVRSTTIKTLGRPLSYRDKRLYKFILAKIRQKGFALPSEIYKLGLIHNLYTSVQGYNAIILRLKHKGLIASDGSKIVLPSPNLDIRTALNLLKNK